MKNITVFFLFALMAIIVKAQDIDSTKRNISLKILDKKERPMSNIVVYSLSDTNGGFTDRTGLFVFNNMSDSDTISMMLPRVGETFVPVAEMDSIVIKMRSARRYYYMNNEGQNVALDRHRHITEPTDMLDVQAMLKNHSYNSLAELLQGVAGLTFTPEMSNRGVQANIRGPISIYGSNEPLVVLDGIRIGTFSNANNMISINEIKTVEVLKNGAEWGMDGANGVIVIKTK